MGGVRIVCLSDTHNSVPDLVVPDGDLLLHGGDHTRRGSLEELRVAADWLRSLPHRHKVMVGGNHDFGLQGKGRSGHELFAPMTYLEDQSVEVEGLRIYGSPWTPEHGTWAFQAPRGEPMARIWRRIPDDIQLLITHGPPADIFDMTVHGRRVGCADLARRVADVRPGLHLFGHIHEEYGVLKQEGTLFVNGSSCALGYAYSQAPHVFDWDGRDFHVVYAGQGWEPLWRFLMGRCGPPRDLSGCDQATWRAESELGHAFWARQESGRVRFRAVLPGEARPAAAEQARALSFGVKLPAHWLSQLSANRWTNLSQIPGP
jgi:Icc-related predicted phosphoesterase